ncbi:MAG: helix-turn-helix domain-containing protein [Cellulosilyticum sp.]|nr:helix-turn-helix domain-containing protein [Cellulosilyticum sp.]
MLSENLQLLRKIKGYSQEYVAEKIGVARQTIAKWENDESIPDIINSNKLAELYEVSLDDLVKSQTDELEIQQMAPNGKYIFGIATLGEKGQIVIPAKARRIFGLNPGDELMVLGDEMQGLALLKADFFLEVIEEMKKEK